MATVSTRYSEADLAEFKAIVEKLIDKGLKKLERLEEDYKDAAETMENEGDWMDDSSSQNDLGMLQTLVYRQRKHVADLQNAMQRIYNKSYGICVVTGELIDKRRLIAVPTTTKSMAAKALAEAPVKEKEKPETEDDDETPKPKPTTKSEPVIITRVIKKSTTAPPKIKDEDDDDDDDLDVDLDDDILADDDSFDENLDDDFDFDEVVDDSSYDD